MKNEYKEWIRKAKKVIDLKNAKKINDKEFARFFAMRLEKVQFRGY